MSYPNFAARWVKSGGVEHANYGLFLPDLCELLGVSRPELTTDNPTQAAYVFERGVAFYDGAGKTSTSRIDLYKRGCFVLETKQSTNSPDQQAAAAKAELGQPAEKRRRGHAVRGTAKWGQMMETTREQALRYVRALPATEPRPPFVVIVDVGYCLDVYSNFAGVGETYVPFPDSQAFRIFLPDLFAVVFSLHQQLGAAVPAAYGWPAELAQQMQAVRAVVQSASQPLGAVAVAARFQGATAKKVQPLLEMLASLALLRVVEEENAYAA